MKRLWLGLILLLGFPILGFGINHALETLHQPISYRLEAAAQESMAGDWQAALEEASQAQDQWEAARNLTSALCSHGVPDEIDALFARLEAYEAARNRSEFAAACRELAFLLRHPTEAQQLNWWNLL